MQPKGFLDRLPVIFIGGLALAAAVGLAISLRNSPTGPVVVIYTALDEQFSRPILDKFTDQTGVRVLAKYDTESTKSVGLTQALIAERMRPRCDVFWNNEIVNTLRLARDGLLQDCDNTVFEAFPVEYRSKSDLWCGFAARARVLLVNTEIVSAEAMPTGIEDLCDPQWKDQVGIAKPLAGTTASHAATLFAVWGEERAREFFRCLKANAQVLGGNKQVARAVATGALAFGLTDTDDELIEIEAGFPVKIVYPDQQAGELGTLFIPNTVAMIKDAPHPENAQLLIEYLLSPEVEQTLAEGPSAQIPLRPKVAKSSRVESPETVNAMKVDFDEAASKWEEAVHFLREEFATAN